MPRIVFAAALSLLVLGGCHADAAMTPVDLAAPASATASTLQHVRRAGTPQRIGEFSLQRYTFEVAATPALTVTPAGGGWKGSGADELHVQVQNAMPWAVTLTVDIDGADPQQHLHAQVPLPAGPPQTLVIPLQAGSPRAMGMQAAPPMPFDDHGRAILLATTVQGRLDRGAVRAVRLGIPAPQAEQTLLLGRVELVPGQKLRRDAYSGIVDAWGQASRARWPGKIDSDAALREAHAQERTVLARAKAAPDTDPYGGRLDVRKFSATGWFHTHKAAGRWHLVTPAGHAFFSLGVNAVSADGGRSYVEGREFMFEGLPPQRGEWAAFYGSGDNRSGDQAASRGIGYNHGRWFDFYAANLYRVDGGAWQEAWRARTLARLPAWGFNTLGNWSNDALGQAHKLPYTRSINIAGDYANVATGLDYWGRMPDPFDPRFVQAADAAVAKASAGVRDDPWLLGYFADNELAWAGAGPQGRWALAVGTLAGDERSPAKQAFIAMLRKKYVAPETLSAAWGIALGSWEALAATGYAAPVPNEAHPAIADDYSAWLRRYADAYFRTVAEAIDRHDPHHLFLGGRFAVHTPEAVASCAQYCDVVSFNIYATLPQQGYDAAALRRLDKPVLIGEFHFGSADRGPFGAGVVPVWNEQQRGEAYARFIAAAAADPAIVGAHWFQYVDQPVTGRLLDGENSHIGLVGITDIPFGGFVEAVRAANRAVVQSHE